VGRLLVARGLLGHNELACRVVAAICDATHALLQSDDHAPVRFAPGEQHAFGVVARVELSVLGDETARRLRAVPAPRRGRPFLHARPPGRRVSQVHHDAHAVRQPAASYAQDGPR
jgi:hypothetical protein